MFNFPSKELAEKFFDFLWNKGINPPPPKPITCYIVIACEVQSLKLKANQEAEILLGEASIVSDKGNTIFFDREEAEMIAVVERSLCSSKQFFVQEVIVNG